MISMEILFRDRTLTDISDICVLLDIFSLQGTVDKLIGRALLAVDYISDNLTKEQILPLISVLATLMIIGAAGYGMSYLV